MILAIDPGDRQSAYVLMDEDCSIRNQIAGKLDNDLLMMLLKRLCKDERMTVVIEMVASYGMAVGREVFETCVWIGRFTQAARDAGCKVRYVYRIEEKLAICHDSRAKDSNIRQALIDRFARFDRRNGKGTKSSPDTFYGFKADMWSAFAVGVTWLDKRERGATDGDRTEGLRQPAGNGGG